MSGLLPIVDELADCQTHAERARWLLACPLDLLYSHGLQIRTTVRNAGFPAGAAYIEAEMIGLKAVRDGRGNHKPKIQDMLQRARDGVLSAAGQ